jgi:hypothetical protein
MIRSLVFRESVKFRCSSPNFHDLLGITQGSDLLTHPKLGASWEGFAVEQLIRSLNALYLLVPGDDRYPLEEGIQVIGLQRLATEGFTF